jgi:hypothetical protein
LGHGKIGTDFAEEILAYGRPMEDCLNVLDFDPFPSPSADEQSALCIFHYAEITKKPKACELLLPSEYGLACLSNVGGLLQTGIRCHIFTGGTELYCKGDGEADLVAKIPQIKNCSLYERQDAREWCHFIRTYQYNVNECSSMTSAEALDVCNTGLAFREKNASLCSAVRDVKRKEYCELRINTWVNYPELRGSSYFGKPVPIDEESI